jgi:uncharacterized protein (TIGR02145 family)
VFDIDSIVFKIDKWQPLTIGSQVWMLKNLDVDHYRNGDSITEVKENDIWSKLKTGAWCYFNNSDSLGKIYGKIYNWFAVDETRGLAPSGWHIASEDEWITLTLYLGGKYVAGGKLKEIGTTHWNSPNEGATNESGFTALPGSLRNFNGDFYWNYQGDWWTSTEFSTSDAWFRTIYYYDFSIDSYHYFKVASFSVRCIMDGK